MTLEELFRKTDIFASLPAAHVQQIAARLERQEFPKGTDLVKQGQEGEALYIIESGRVGVFVSSEALSMGVEVAQLGPGDCVGELALITGEARLATCTALVDTVAHRLSHNVFNAILSQSTAVQRDLVKVMARRLSAISAKQGVQFISLEQRNPDPRLMALVPKQVIQQRLLMPLEYEGDVVILAAVDPFNVSAFEEIQRYLRGMRIRPVAVSRDDFNRFIDRIGLTAEKGRQLSRPPEEQIHFFSEAEESDRGSAMSGKEVMTLVNQIIATGIESGASDIHVEPVLDGMNVRYRINGTLETKHRPIKAEARKSLIARFKVLAKLDITETRKPQEGRISLDMEGRTVDLRLSLIPTRLGQNLVIRILDANTALASLDKIVLVEQTRQMVRKMVYAPHGVVLVTGPTGSGKTTTIYSALHERRSPEINIVTVEDPVEFHIDGLTQVEIGLTSGIDFASVLRSFLRQDPDIILVGETRDAETAKLALQAGLTGRLVFTSFHTNDCGSAIVRLLEMGMEPFALANALVGVIHQRLIRRLCPHCKMPFEYFPQVIDNLRASGVIGSTVPTLYKTKGCDRCKNQGFLGRVAAMEVLPITDPVRVAIYKQASPSEILAAASKSSFIPLPWYLGALLQGGLTVPGEALSVLPRADL